MTSVGRRRRHCNARTLRLGTYTSSAALQQARAVSRRWNTESPWSQPRRTSAGSQTDTCTRASREHYSRVQVAINQHKDDAAVVQPQNGMSFRKKKKKKKHKKKTSTNTCHHTEGHGKRDARQKAAAPKDHKRQSSISVQRPKKGQSMEPESRFAVAGLEQGPTANRTEGPRLSDGDVPSTSDWAVAARL